MVSTFSIASSAVENRRVTRKRDLKVDRCGEVGRRSVATEREAIMSWQRPKVTLFGLLEIYVRGPRLW